MPTLTKSHYFGPHEAELLDCIESASRLVRGKEAKKYLRRALDIAVEMNRQLLLKSLDNIEKASVTNA